MSELIPLSVGFTLGLFSTLHCLGMCGGIVSALSCALPKTAEGNPLKRNGYVMLYNLGRILTYSFFGLVAGAGGGLLLDLIDSDVSHRLAMLVAGISLILAGVYLGGWVSSVRRIDLIGRSIWHRVEPLGRRLLPIRSPMAALAAGLIWGWLPCGLVYYALLAAAPLGDPLSAAAFMAAFGLGTVPGMQATGIFGGLMVRITRHARMRSSAAAVIVALGLLGLLFAMTNLSHRFMPVGGHSTGLHHGTHRTEALDLRQH